MKSTANLIALTKGQLAGDRAHLEKLQMGVRSANLTIRCSTIAYEESRILLERINGVPNSPAISENHIPD